MKNKLLLIIVATAIVFVAKTQTIATTRGGTLLSNVSFSGGTVLNGSELGSIRYVQDATGGISIYGTNLSIVNRGDIVTANGTLTCYKSLLEITPVTFTVNSTGNILPTPTVVTPNQMHETYESKMVRINNCTFTLGGSTFAGNTNYAFTSSAQTGYLRINTSSPLVGTIIPSSAVDLIGITSQFNSAGTCAATDTTAGYQLLARDANDIIQLAPIFLTSQPYPTNITTSGMNINWNTNVSSSSYILYGKTPQLELGQLNGVAGISHLVPITGATPATIYYVQVFSVLGLDTAKSLVKVFCTQSTSSGVIKAYFNRSVDNTVSTGINAIYLNGLMDDTLIAYINRAKYSIDIAIYNWDNSNSSNITTAVNAAYTRGVKVRIIYDGSTTQSGLSTINPAIKFTPSPQGANYTIMHNKFIIIDVHSALDAALWTGSMNWTSAQLSTDANNVIIFQDQSIAKGYKIEFDEMWGDSTQTSNANTSLGKFGLYKTDNTPHEYNINGKRVESYFSPSDGTTQRMIATIQTANTDYYFAEMNVTRSDIAGAFASAAAITTTHKGILDDTASASGPYFTMKGGMGSSNIQLHTFSWIFHHKYFIVDPSNTGSDPLVWTGSHNCSNNAEFRNDENSVVVHDATIANIYLQEFTKRWNDQLLQGIETIDFNYFNCTVFPNPNNGEYSLAYSLKNNQKINVSVFDYTGKLVVEKNLLGSTGKNVVQFTQLGLSKGLYIIVLSNGTDTEVKKVIVE